MEPLSKIFGHRVPAYLSFSSWLAVFASSLYAPIYAAFVEHLGGDLIAAGYAWSAFAFSSAIVTFIAGDLSERYDKKLIATLGAFIASTGILIFYFAKNPWHIAIGEVLIGIGWAITNPAWDALFSMHLDMRRPSKIWSYYYTGTYFSQGIGAILGGLLAATLGFKTLFLLSALITYLSAAILYLKL